MKPIRMRVPIAARVVSAGVWSVLLAATMLLGSACLVDSEAPIDE